MYKSILEFRATDLRKWWPETYELLGVEKLRGRIEANVKAVFDYDRQIFRKEQTFMAVCQVCLLTDDLEVMAKARTFLDKYKDADLLLLNQVECALLRIARKSNVLRAYPKLREEIGQALESAPELIRFVSPPSAFTITYGAEVERHHRIFDMLKQLSDADLTNLLGTLLPIEAAMEDALREARAKLSDSERQLLGFEIYGEGGRHYLFKGRFT